MPNFVRFAAKVGTWLTFAENMKFRVTHDGVARTYAALRHTAWHLLQMAKTHNEGSLLTLQAVAVFNAFTFEAYLNHVGAEEIEFWNEIDRISYVKKLRIIQSQLKMAIDNGKPPFQVIQEVFDLRNILADGRTQTINESYETDTEPVHRMTWNILEWEKLTPDKVELYSKSVDEAIMLINAARATPDEMIWDKGIRGRTVEVIK